MNSFNQVSIGVRLGIGFALLIATILGTALFARLSLAEVNRELRVLTEDRMVQDERLEDVRDSINITARSVRNVVMVADATAAAPAAPSRPPVGPSAARARLAARSLRPSAAPGVHRAAPVPRPVPAPSALTNARTATAPAESAAWTNF